MELKDKYITTTELDNIIKDAKIPKEEKDKAMAKIIITNDTMATLELQERLIAATRRLKLS